MNWYENQKDVEIDTMINDLVFDGKFKTHDEALEYVHQNKMSEIHKRVMLWADEMTLSNPSY